MTNIQDIFISGLRNAHAMENQALSIMRPQVGRIEHYPEVAAQLEKHIKETESQIQRLEQILDEAGESKSGLKDLALSLTGTMASLGHTVAPDEIIKNSLANFAFENFEIAAYKSLISLADPAGHASAQLLLKANLAEEQAMAKWLDDNIATVTLQYAALRESGEKAKR